LATPP